MQPVKLVPIGHRRGACPDTTQQARWREAEARVAAGQPTRAQ